MVVAILAILAWIAYVYYWGNTVNTQNTVRWVDLRNLIESINTSMSQGNSSIPPRLGCDSNKTNCLSDYGWVDYTEWNLIWENSALTKSMNKIPTDPETDEPYRYATSIYNKNNFQFLAYKKNPETWELIPYVAWKFDSRIL